MYLYVLYIWYVLYIMIGIHLRLYSYVCMCIGMYFLDWYLFVCIVYIGRYLYVFVCIVNMMSLCVHIDRYWSAFEGAYVYQMYCTYSYVLACIVCIGLYL